MRSLIGLFAVSLLASAPALGANDSLVFKEQDGIRWYDIRQLGVEGQGWTENKSLYDRLPARAEGVVRDAVWNLSRDSAGMCVRFQADPGTLHARWTLTKANLAMPHMAATGVSGVDLYAKDDKGTWRWVSVGRPTAQTNTQKLADGIPAGNREWLLYLPLYNGVTSVEIGVPAGKTVQQAPAYAADHSRPIVFYGTSITHGACASRPGMVHTAILGRRYGRPVINLGFSGNGRMEPEVTALLAELDAAIYVIDCCPNLSGNETAERTRPLVDQLRKTRPDVPIVLVEDRVYTDAWLIASKKARNDGNHAALKKSFDELIAAGTKQLYYVPGTPLLGDDDEGAVDSSHPNDLGFMRQADAFDKVLGPLLK
ncbi:MAG: SGNH/GDSL hydrolase family protein [Planctomycetes bacterium]|nr:SGNH/GDSL hydrolase family protein [Planctomycetota bacterium]